MTRRGHVRDPLSYYESPKCWLYLINTALRESGFHACISSRITTVIHIFIHQINYNCFKEPFAVSLYNTILTHAWVNL